MDLGLPVIVAVGYFLIMNVHKFIATYEGKKIFVPSTQLPKLKPFCFKLLHSKDSMYAHVLPVICTYIHFVFIKLIIMRHVQIT